MAKQTKLVGMPQPVNATGATQQAIVTAQQNVEILRGNLDDLLAQLAALPTTGKTTTTTTDGGGTSPAPVSGSVPGNAVSSYGYGQGYVACSIAPLSAKATIFIVLCTQGYAGKSPLTQVIRYPYSGDGSHDQSKAKAVDGSGMYGQMVIASDLPGDTNKYTYVGQSITGDGQSSPGQLSMLLFQFNA